MGVDEVADALFAAIERGDVDAVAALYTDDAVVWHNFDRAEQPRDQNLAVLAWMTRHVDNLAYTDVERHVIDGGFVQQHVLRGTVQNGTELDVPCCLVVRVEGDRIARIAEYLDTAHLQALLG
jgi:ketosteroid isomerase-like protein